MKQAFLSKMTLFLLIFICAWYGRNLNSWGQNKVIQNDVVSYYAYLPAIFIFGDPGFDFVRDLPEDFEGTIWLQTAPGGEPVLRMTMGLAVLWTPFFLGAHAYARMTGISALGYSWPYGLSIFLAALFYLAAGLFFLRKMLLLFFSDKVVAVTLILLVAGTNLMHYVISEPGMPHVYNFSLISAFLYFSLLWTKKKQTRYILVSGLLAGVIILIRPVNGWVILFPALTGIFSLNDFRRRLVNHWPQILLAGIVAFVVIVPQMLYWKAQTGHFIFNSYMDEGKFFFLKPQIVNGLFSFRKGWFVYTPVMIFAVTGLFFLRKPAAPLFLPVLLFLVVNIYTVYSWWCWWYGGSFGSRPMIDMYGVMAFPLSAFIQKVWTGKRWIRGLAVILFAGLIWLNQFQMAQYRISLLHWDSMTKEAYRGIFGRKTWPEGYEQMIQNPDYDKALKGEEEY